MKITGMGSKSTLMRNFQKTTGFTRHQLSEEKIYLCSRTEVVLCSMKRSLACFMFFAGGRKMVEDAVKK